MKWIKKSIIISILAIVLILVISCSGPASAPEPTLTSSPTATTTSTPISSPSTQATNPVPTPSPTSSSLPSPSSVTPTPTPSASPTPTPTPTPNPAEDNKFYIDRTISGYNQVPKADGTIEQVPIYQDVYLNLNILGYYTKKDAIFVPRIPTITDHDDWFIRISLPGSLTKPWIMNWDYTINKSSPSANTAALTATVYTQEIFNADYYYHPDLLLGYDLKGDRQPSSTGINCKYFQNPGNYVILLRTNNADAISDFWIKLGTTGNIVTPTP